MNSIHILALAVPLLCAVPQSAGQGDSVQTRSGKLEVSRQGILLFKGHPVEPTIQANQELFLGTPFRIGHTDVVLVRNEGGTACPYLYSFVSVTQSGAAATREFGTCNEVTSVRRDGDSIVLKMRGYRGPFEPQAERLKATAEIHTFVFRDGTVTETGAGEKSGPPKANGPGSGS